MKQQETLVELKSICKSFDGKSILNNLDLKIYNGEFLTILGPSGCGKTTTLRLIAGFEQADSGDILLQGKRINDIPANNREVHTVFQNYALFPHMTVFDNIAFNMQKELKQLQRKLGITFVLVTHDREEALSMSDRVIVMNQGIIEQCGTPKNLYEEPNSIFVANFIGDVNVLNGEVLGFENNLVKAKVEGRICSIKTKKELNIGEKFTLLLRAEDMRIEKLSEYPDTEGLMVGNIETKVYKGATLDTTIKLNNGTIIKASEFFDEEYEDFDYNMNEQVSVGWVSGWEVVLKDERA